MKVPWLTLALACPTILIAGCDEGIAGPDKIVADAQENSFIGPTSDLEFEDISERSAFSEKRNRAYQFCIDTREVTSDQLMCFDDQDHSLLSARSAITYAESILENGLVVDGHEFGAATHEFGIVQNPEIWSQAKEYCFSVYEDAGRNDARMLGPCLTNVVGGDFFRAVPVP